MFGLYQLDQLLTDCGATAYSLGEQDDSLTHVITQTVHFQRSPVLQDRLDRKDAFLCTVGGGCRGRSGKQQLTDASQPAWAFRSCLTAYQK
jgi:hypothetical protein